MVYLDYAATTPFNKEVIKTHEQLLEKYFYNADSIYSQGIEVNRLLEKSRSLIAGMLHVKDEEIIFTSCGSEANNMAIKGIAFQYQNRENILLRLLLNILRFMKHVRNWKKFLALM